MLTSSVHAALEGADCLALADTLGDQVGTTIDVHSLQRGLARAYVLGSPTDFRAAVVEAGSLPAEPHGFGEEPRVLYDLLRDLRGWDCVLVRPHIADELLRLIAADGRETPRLYDSISLALAQPARSFSSPMVRRLAESDLPLLACTPEELHPDGFGSTRASVVEGCAAAALLDGEIASIAYVEAMTARHGEISINTADRWRGQGLATAAASWVAGWLQTCGRTPVWSTGADNRASLRVAQKLGFESRSELTFVIRGSEVGPG